MAYSDLKLFIRCAEFHPKNDLSKVPWNTRGIYILYMKRGNQFDVVYVGMAGGKNEAIRFRLRRHAQSKRKKNKWTHFSVFEVWPNIRSDEIEELEGLLRHIYRKDSIANKLNIQKKYKPFRRIGKRLERWGNDI